MSMKKVGKIAVGVLVAGLLLFAGGFKYKWFYADKPLPAVASAPAVSKTAEGFEDRTADFDAALSEFYEDLKVPALSAAIYVDGKLAWAGAKGWADIETRTPITLDHRFRLGSTSKPFTAALAYKMEEQGLVDTSAPISQYIPSLPEAYGKLTLKELLSHTAGVRNYQASFTMFPPHEGLSDDQYATATDALDVFIGSPLNFKPGEQFSYSAWGFVLASAVLEAAGGEDFPALMENELLGPANLTETLVEFSGTDTSPSVSFYLTNDGNWTLDYPVNTSVKWAAGGLVSTPSGVADFGAKLLDGEILSEKSLQALWTPVPLSGGTMNEQNYGQGFRIDTSVRLFGEDRKTQIYHHGGLVAGGSSFFMIVPEYGISVSVQANTPEIAARIGVQDLAYELVRIAAGEKDREHD